MQIAVAYCAVSHGKTLHAQAGDKVQIPLVEHTQQRRLVGQGASELGNRGLSRLFPEGDGHAAKTRRPPEGPPTVHAGNLRACVISCIAPSGPNRLLQPSRLG
jgi:hypothetical protein